MNNYLKHSISIMVVTRLIFTINTFILYMQLKQIITQCSNIELFLQVINNTTKIIICV